MSRASSASLFCPWEGLIFSPLLFSFSFFFPKSQFYLPELGLSDVARNSQSLYSKSVNRPNHLEIVSHDSKVKVTEFDNWCDHRKVAPSVTIR